MSQMHPDTLAALRTRLLAEIAGDPAYGGLGAAEIAGRLNAPVVIAAAPAYQDVSISDVEGYLRARLLVTRLRAWAAEAGPGVAQDAALELLDIIASQRLSNFSTGTLSGRTNILGMFALLVQAGAGGLVAQNLDDLTAMTVAPAGPPQEAPARWSVLIEGLAEAPNAADAALVAELLA